MSLQLQSVELGTANGDNEGQLVFSEVFLVALLVRLSDLHQNEAGM